MIDGNTLNAVLVPALVPAEHFDKIIPGLMALGNLDGLLVTVPFKARMVPFASRLGATAQCISAVNALRREADGSWTGDMFDGEGFLRGVERKGERIRGRRVLMFGAGGAGSAVACALAGAGVESIGIVDPNAGRVEACRGTAWRVPRLPPGSRCLQGSRCRYDRQRRRWGCSPATECRATSVRCRLTR